jgi:hypothetical protein
MQRPSPALSLNGCFPRDFRFETPVIVPERGRLATRVRRVEGMDAQIRGVSASRGMCGFEGRSVTPASVSLRFASG